MRPRETLSIAVILLLISGCSLLRVSPNTPLTPLEIIKMADASADSIENQRWQTIEETDRLEAHREIALATAQAGDQNTSKTLFDHLIEQIKSIEDVSESTKELQKMNAELNRGNPSFGAMTPERNHWTLIIWKIKELNDIATAQTQAGQSSAAIQTFERAETLTPGLPYEDKYSGRLRINALQHIAIARLKAGDRSGAQAIIEKAIKELELQKHDEQYVPAIGKFYVVQPFIWSQLELGDPADASIIDQALEAAPQLPVAWERAFVFRDVAMLQARKGDREAALSTLEQLFLTREAILDEQYINRISEYNLIDALKVAESFIQAGMKEEAEKLIQKTIERLNEIKGEHAEETKSFVLNRIARVRAQLGDIKGALEANQSDSISLFFIFHAQLKAGDIRGAQKTLTTAGAPDWTSLSDLAIAQAQHGDTHDAMATIKTINANFRGQALREIARTRIKSENQNKVVTWALKQPTPIERTYALLGISDGLISQKALKTTP